MTDLPGYEEAVAAYLASTDEQKAALRQHQLGLDRERAAFDKMVQTAEPSTAELRGAMLANMTTKPNGSIAQLMLTWMQRSPESWVGLHPEECQHAANMNGIGEEV
jgi:hypothetical protein